MQATPLWHPQASAVESSQLTKFTVWLEGETKLAFPNYDALHAWSVEYPAEFWRHYWIYSGLIASQFTGPSVENLNQFPGARWFPDVKLNFAENLLREDSDRIAFVSILENGTRQTVSYRQLHHQTAYIAQGLRDTGIIVGDRVAGWLPNIPEAASAMLATSSIGAVWSSCSPDFGAPGALDRFGQIEPRVLVACNGYFYNGNAFNIVDKVREVANQVPSIELILWVDVLDLGPVETRAQEVTLESWQQGPAPELSFAQLPFDHPLFILYSSGTTGKPKCIVHGQGGTLLQHKKEHQLHTNLKPDDRLFFFTTCGWMMWNWLISALASRTTIILFDGSPTYPNENAMFDLCEQEGVTIFGISAKFLSNMQKAGVKPIQTHNLSAIHTVISTGSPLTDEGFKYVYESVKPECHLVSMSGGTDIISCFMLGNPNLPVFAGEIQSAGLGMATEIWDEEAQRIIGEKGELVCTVPFPSAPIGFWSDPDNNKYRAAYFDIHPNIWVHGDYAEQTLNGGYIIHGRSDAILNPGGVRIGTAEIYRQVEFFEQITDAVCVGQQWQDDVRVILFVMLKEGQHLGVELIDEVKGRIKTYASPRHTPAKVIQVDDIPRTMSGKIAELAVRNVIHNEPVKNTSALANPESLSLYQDLEILQS